MSLEVESHLENGARLLFEMHDAKAACDEFSRALAIDPRCFVAFVYRHFAFCELKDWRKALSDVNQALKLSPDDERLYRYRADLHIQLHEYAPAYDDICEALRMFGYVAQDIQPYKIEDEFAGLEDVEAPPAMMADDYEEMAAETSTSKDAAGVQSCIEGSPGSVSCSEHSNCRSEEQSDATEDEDCELLDDEQDEALETFAHFIWTRGYLALKLHRYEQAIEDFGLIVDMHPEDACAYNNRGLAFTRLGMFEEALSDFTRAIELNPDHPDHHNSRANLYVLMGNEELAFRDSENAIETCDRVFDPRLGDDVVWNDRAEALVRLKRFDEAIETVMKSLELRADDPESNRILAEAYCALGRDQEALALFDKSIRSDMDPEVLLKRADLLEKLGESERAKKDRNLASKKMKVKAGSPR